MIPEQIDQLLNNWNTRLDRASQNMLALQELVTYQRLTGDAGLTKAELTGITAVQVSSALDAINQVFQHFDQLLVTIRQAATLRKQVPRFLGSDEKLQAIEHLLTGSSIQLSVAQVPLAQRGLLSATETTDTVTPEQLLTSMSSTFETARNTILAVDLAWSHLDPTLAQAEAELQTLQQQASILGLDNLKALVAVQQAIAPLRDQVATDPLGVRDEFATQIQPLIEQATASLNQVIQQRTQVEQRFAKAQTLLQQLTGLNQEAQVAYNECLEKVTDHTHLQRPLAADQINAMHQWLSRLKTRFAEGLISPIQVGLDKWMTQVEAMIAIEQGTVRANCQPLELRRELRGRLEALKAKALARGRAEDPVLVAISVEAKQILYTRPTNLAKAMEVIVAYEKQLNRQ